MHLPVYNTLDEAAKKKVVIIQEDLDCLATFQLLNEKNNELLQVNEDILNNLLTSEKVEEDDNEKETISADEYAYKFKKINLLINRKADSDVDIYSRSSIRVTKRKFKLPPLELIKFEGDIKDWLQFWGYNYGKLIKIPILMKPTSFPRRALPLQAQVALADNRS